MALHCLPSVHTYTNWSHETLSRTAIHSRKKKNRTDIRCHVVAIEQDQPSPPSILDQPRGNHNAANAPLTNRKLSPFNTPEFSLHTPSNQTERLHSVRLISSSIPFVFSGPLHRPLLNSPRSSHSRAGVQLDTGERARQDKGQMMQSSHF